MSGADALFWGTAVASCAAVWANNHRRTWCFPVWLVTNAVWAVASWTHGLPSKAALHVVYLGLAVHGWRCWARKPRPAAEANLIAWALRAEGHRLADRAMAVADELRP